MRDILADFQTLCIAKQHLQFHLEAFFRFREHLGITRRFPNKTQRNSPAKLSILTRLKRQKESEC